MSSSFVCSTCGETHEGMPTDHAWTLPDDVWAVPKEERANKASFNSDLCQFGDRFFIRCILQLPFKSQPEYYGWGIWVELAAADFHHYVKIFDEDGSAEPLVAASIANAIPGYPSTLGLPVHVQFQDSTSRPLVLVPEGSHPLFADQSSGLDDRRYHEILISTGSIDRV
jgi:hypothetical protein